MKTEIKTLIVDDHPMIVEGYRAAISNIQLERHTISIDVADSCDSGYQKIKKAAVSIPYDIILLDIKLPPSTDGKVLSGEDLGLKCRQLLPNCRIIILTMFNNNFRIHNILRNIDPDGFLIKSDVNSDELVKAFEVVLTDPPYYSHTVTKLLRSQITNDFILDDIDRSILYHLSVGTKTKDLPNYIPLSLAAIEKRKRHLKEIFDLSSQGDKALIEKSREKGFI